MNRIPRRVFTAEYKSEAIKLAGAVGVPTRGAATRSCHQVALSVDQAIQRGQAQAQRALEAHRRAAAHP